jgi:hypothetical protein
MAKKNVPTALSIAAAVTTLIATSTAAAAPNDGTSLTIYSSAQPGTLSSSNFKDADNALAVPGYAVIKQSREFNLNAGRTIVRVSDVPNFIDPTTVSFASLTDPATTSVVEQSFEFDLTSTTKLLDKYLDREVTVDISRGTATESITGTLLGTQGGLVLRLTDGSLRTVTTYNGVRLTALPGGLISKPTLVWDINTKQAGAHKTRYTYQTGGITWWADYNLTLKEDKGCTMDLSAWVTIVNQTGARFEDANLKLVAGDVKRVQPEMQDAMRFKGETMRAMATTTPQGFTEKAFFEYHLYTLGRTTTLANNSTKQLELLPVSRGVRCEQVLVYSGQAGQYFGGGLMTERDLGVPSNKKVDVLLRFKNSKEAGLGMPLPAGKIRVSKLDTADDSLEFVGEDLIIHTPKDETLLLKLGSAFDVVGSRRQVDFRVDTTAKWMEEDIEVKVRNQKDVPATVIVKENLNRWTNWNVIRKNQEFSKIDSRTLHFPLTLATGAEGVVKYTVRYSW